ncbi:MAG: radical SAM protein [Clostridia bacterium]|nr:radical SAM protein [Clostridia bacterium]
MEAFSISKVYVDDYGQVTVDINPLPSNYCSFDCVFCPLGRTAIQTDEAYSFVETEDFMEKLDGVLKSHHLDWVFINPNGESLANAQLIEIIKRIKSYGVKVRLLSNGYLFNKKAYRASLNLCDEVIGELAVTNEGHFQKIQRPLKGYSYKDYVENIACFKQQYHGKFLLDITVLKDYSDSVESVESFKAIIERIRPNGLIVQTPTVEKFKRTFGVEKEKLDEIRRVLDQVISSMD